MSRLFVSRQVVSCLYALALAISATVFTGVLRAQTAPPRKCNNGPTCAVFVGGSGGICGRVTSRSCNDTECSKCHGGCDSDQSPTFRCAAGGTTTVCTLVNYKCNILVTYNTCSCTDLF